MKSSRIHQLILWLIMSVSIPVMADISPQQLDQFSNNCLQCHAAPDIPAPQLGDTAAWSGIAEKGEQQLLINIVEGIRSMPPLGYCSSCNEDDFIAMIRLMTGSKQKNNQ